MTTIALYFRERVRAAIFVPAIALLAGLSIWTVSARDAAGILLVTAVMAVLVVQFRIWDDLEDRDADALAHPGRVIVRRSPGPVRALARSLAAIALLMPALTNAPRALAIIAALDVAFWLLYRHGRARLPHRVWQFHVLPLKYPGFVAAGALAAGAPPDVGRLIGASVVAYLGATAYEVLHTRQPATAGAER